MFLVLLFGIPILGGASRAAESKPSWQIEWDKIVAAAKKEGRLNFYVGRYGSEKLLNEFRKEFPEIKIVGTNGAGNSLGTRIVSEVRAGNVLADLYSGGAVTNFEILYKGKTLDSLKSALILPEVLDPSKWYGGKHCFNDPEQEHVFIYIANPTSASIYYNTVWSIPRISNLFGIWSSLSGKASSSRKSLPVPASVRRCNFSIIIRSSDRNFCASYSSISSRCIQETGAR